MTEMSPVETFVHDVAEQLEPDGIAVELLTPDVEKPGLVSCSRPDASRTVFLLADASDCSHERAEVMADYVRQEISPT